MKTKLKLVKNNKKPRPKTIRRKVLSTYNRSLSIAQQENWDGIIIIGCIKNENSVVYSTMNDDRIVASLERAKQYIINTTPEE